MKENGEKKGGLKKWDTIKVMFGNWELQINIALKNQETTKQSRKTSNQTSKVAVFSALHQRLFMPQQSI